MNNKMRIEIDNVLSNVAVIRVAITSFISGENISLDEIMEIKTAVSEAVTNETYGLLLKCPEFVKASDLGDKVVQNGQVGRFAGLDVYETNNIADENLEYIIGNKVFCHFVDEWLTKVSVEDLKDGKHIGSSAVQGRRVYGKKISRPIVRPIKNQIAPKGALFIY